VRTASSSFSTRQSMTPDTFVCSGRFHASLAFTRQAFEQVGGWPLTLRGDFDQQLISRLNGLGHAADPYAIASPSCVFRWGSTGAYHGQALMRGPDDETWYSQLSPKDAPSRGLTRSS